jgi:hypothetical protein
MIEKTRFLSLALLLCVLYIAGCGPLIQNSSSSNQPLGLPDYISNPKDVSRVLEGSLDVVTGTPPGTYSGPVLVTLFSEPGASIEYSFADLSNSQSLLTTSKYKNPFLAYPPFTVWCQVTKKGKKGKIKFFKYKLDRRVYPLNKSYSAPKLPHKDFKPLELSTNSDSIFFPAGNVSNEKSIKATFKADGKNKEWTSQGRLFLRDSLHDVPTGLEHIDISWMQAGETDSAFIVAIGLREQPKRAAKVAYGFEIGASNVTTSSFGPGATYTYKIEIRNEGLRILDSDLEEKSQVLKHSSNSLVARNDIIEFHILKSDLPKIKSVNEIVIRGYAVDWTPVTTVFDRVDPLYMRSSFDLTSTTVTLPGKRHVDFNFMSSGSISDEFIQNNLNITETIVQELEDFNRMPLFGTGYIPTFYVSKEENGYAGLNTTDRGILTTMGQYSSRLVQTQLMTHEFAHYQNARNSNINARWIQEGMSEWTSERILGRLFPKRAVYTTFRTLRFNRYFKTLDDGFETIALDSWGEEKSNIGYEKSLMMMDMLSFELGDEALKAAFQYGVSTSMDSSEFMNFLSDYTGKDVSYLFNGWVFEGNESKGLAPEDLFLDDDGDELLNIDELILGSDKNSFDSDGDGYTDGEEYFRGMDPASSEITLSNSKAPLLTNRSSTDSSALFRLGGHKNQAYTFSLNPDETSPSTVYTGPKLMRPPYAVSVEGSGSAYVLDRPLYVGGNKIVHTFEQDLILPNSAKGSISYASGITNGLSVGVSGADIDADDMSNDLPSWLSDYDVVETTVSEDSDFVTIVVKTKTPPDDLGTYGDYVIVFDNLEWEEASTGYIRRNALTISSGSVFWHSYDAGYETSEALLSGVIISYGKALTVKIEKSKFSNWSSTTERQICAWSRFELLTDFEHTERAGCVILDSPDFTRRGGQVASYFGTGNHTLEVFINDSGFTNARVNTALSLGLSGIREFEKALARPSWDRSMWRIHLQYNNESYFSGAGDITSGAWLTGKDLDTNEDFEYLIVEQLARLAASDSLDREKTATDYFIQELYVQWLTAAAMYQIYPTESVHDYHKSRLDNYMCYTPPDSSCTSQYSRDVYLADWDNDTESGSSASMKSLLLTLLLNAEIGSAPMAEVMSTFTNGWPTPTELKNLLKDAAPNSSSEIDHYWEILVDGSGTLSDDVTAIRVLLDDANANDLYQFEEDKLGSNVTGYFD